MLALYFKLVALPAGPGLAASRAEESWIIFGDRESCIHTHFEEMIAEGREQRPGRYSRVTIFPPVEVEAFLLSATGSEPVNWQELQATLSVPRESPCGSDDETAAVLIFADVPSRPIRRGQLLFDRDRLEADMPSNREGGAVPRDQAAQAEHLYSVVVRDPTTGAPQGQVRLVRGKNFEQACWIARRCGVPFGYRMDIEACPPILHAREHLK